MGQQREEQGAEHTALGNPPCSRADYGPKFTQRNDHTVAFASGLRVAMHVPGKERTNTWSLSVDAVTLQLVYY